jgi:hypothetical protein
MGCKPVGLHTEQHDVNFGITGSITELVPQVKAFWPEAPSNMHLVAFRIIKQVNGYDVQVVKTGEKKSSGLELDVINF